MVLVEGKKYSCETCIKGHRSSNCKHTDRALFEIQKKGRPPTQCAHCRALRRLRQVHVKCMCASANPKDKDEPVKRGTDKILETPAFPHGLAAAVVSSTADGIPADNIHQPDHQCRCDDDGECNCCLPRKSTPRIRKKKSPDCITSNRAASRASPESDSSTSETGPRKHSSLRRLAPKVTTPEENIHSVGGYRGRDHGFNPYGRAYESARPHHTGIDALGSQAHFGPAPILSASLPTTEQSYNPDASVRGSYCACGHVCRCNGCGQAEQEGATPPHCDTCLDCALINSMAAAPQSNMPYPADIDIWVQQQQSVGADTYTDVDPTLANTYDWSALDASAKVASCCTADIYQGAVPPDLSSAQSSSETDSMGWVDLERPVDFFDLYDYAAQMAQLQGTSFPDVQQIPDGMFSRPPGDFHGEHDTYSAGYSQEQLGYATASEQRQQQQQAHQQQLQAQQQAHSNYGSDIKPLDYSHMAPPMNVGESLDFPYTIYHL